MPRVTPSGSPGREPCHSVATTGLRIRVARCVCTGTACDRSCSQALLSGASLGWRLVFVGLATGFAEMALRRCSWGSASADALARTRGVALMPSGPPAVPSPPCGFVPLPPWGPRLIRRAARGSDESPRVLGVVRSACGASDEGFRTCLVASPPPGPSCRPQERFGWSWWVRRGP